MDLLIKNVKIVDYSGDFYGDVYIKDGKISEIGLDIEKSCDVIDGNGKTLMPAFVAPEIFFLKFGSWTSAPLEDPLYPTRMIAKLIPEAATAPQSIFPWYLDTSIPRLPELCDKAPSPPKVYITPPMTWLPVILLWFAS